MPSSSLPSPVGASDCPNPQEHAHFKYVENQCYQLFFDFLAQSVIIPGGPPSFTITMRDPPISGVIRVNCSPTGVFSFVLLEDPPLALNYFSLSYGRRDDSLGAFSRDVNVVAAP